MFGEVPATVVQVVDNREITVLAPPHDPGIVPIMVTLHEQEYSTIEWFGYGMTEPVLLPIAIDSLPGANGARWSTEIWVRNDTDHAVPIDPEYCFFIGLWFPCSRPVERIPAHASVRLTGRGSADYPWERLYPPVQDADSLHLSILVRNVAKDANGPATEIAAVRQRELRSGRVVLPGIANDSRYRSNLRVYTAAGVFFVSLADTVTGAVLATRKFGGLPQPTDGDNFTLWEMHDVLAAPELRGHDRIDVIIEMSQYDRFWALLTLTDNATQQVMAFTPQ